MQTNINYINEDKDIIDFITFVESTDAEINECMTRINLMKKDAGIKLFFESCTKEEYLLFCEEEEESVFGKIGTAIKNMVEKFINFFKNLFEKVKNIFTDVDHDKKVVEKMIQQNPAIGREVVTGIKNEWFTYGDVAKYNKDMMGLYEMILEKRIEHENIQAKIENIEYEYKKSENPLLKGAATVMAIVGAVGMVLNCLDTVDKIKGRFHQLDNWFYNKKGYTIKQGLDAKKAEIDAKTCAIAESVVSKMLTKNAEISNKCNKAMGSIRSTLKGTISKHGKSK